MNEEYTFTDGAVTTTKMWPSGNGGHISTINRDWVEVFLPGKAETPPLHQPIGFHL